ncbi:MAG: 2-C-methyl-D-erythritol 4-phosphate cytidylyltransferase [Bacillota bacterium]|nr:2-C-methyl-D-erythritol 4-phosphate cytidylyltransferase [Bacillota bacterium]
MSNCAIIVAAGKGRRMGAGINKLYLKLNGKPILAHTLEAFQKCNYIDSIILVCSKDEIDYCKQEIIVKYNIKKVKDIAIGGKERQHSVMSGLKAAKGCNIVLIHDGARPFVDESMILNGIKYAEMYGASACGVEPKDTIKVRDKDSFSKFTPDRSTLFAVQTPQCFKYDLIVKAHEYVEQESIQVTDDTSVVEAYGNKVYLYYGGYTNIKITTLEDIAIGERILLDLAE